MSRYGPRADRWVATHWPAIRARGRWRFVLLRGLALWGGLMFLGMAALVAFRLGLQHPRLPLVLVLALPLCLFGGLVWGLLTWFFNERIFRALPTAKNNP